MIKSNPLYVPCASGHNVFTDCLVMRAGDLFRLIGHAQMDFTAEDAKRLAYYILESMDVPYQHVHQSATSQDYANSSNDAIVTETIALLLDRSKRGQEKYGTTLMRNDLTLLDWMRHAIEESLDRTLYMLRAVKDLEKLYDDGR